MLPLKIAIVAGIAMAYVIAHPLRADEHASYQNLLTPLIETRTDIVGQPIAYPPGTPVVTAAIVTIPPGGETGWHAHEVPLFVHVLGGTVTVDYASKGTREYGAGDTFMEAMNWPHNGMNKGTEPARIMAVYIGSDQTANTTVAQAPQ